MFYVCVVLKLCNLIFRFLSEVCWVNSFMVVYPSHPSATFSLNTCRKRILTSIIFCMDIDVGNMSKLHSDLILVFERVLGDSTVLFFFFLFFSSSSSLVLAVSLCSVYN